MVALSAMDGTKAGDEMRPMTQDALFFYLIIMAGWNRSHLVRILVRIAVKPTVYPDTAPHLTAGEEVDVVTKGRHDPCVGIRGVPVAEAMMAIVVLDQLMRHQAQTSFFPKQP